MASRKPLYIVGGVIAGIIAIVVVAVVVIFASIDSIIKAAIENIGPKMTQSSVTLDTVELSTTSGEGRLAGFVIGNPKGFSTPSAMKLGEIGIKLDVSSLTKDTIVIRDILIRAPEITYELGSGGSNIDAIKRNIDSFVGPSGSSKQTASSDGGKKLIIENLRILDAKMSVALAGKEMGATLPAIQLKDIGKSSGGATSAEVADRVFTALQQSVSKAASSLGVDKIKDAAKGALDSATKGVTGGGDAVKGATDAVKGLFGK